MIWQGKCTGSQKPAKASVRRMGNGLTDESHGGGSHTVFVSYSRGDQNRALPIIKILEDAGFSVWWDGLLEGGERFSHITENALEQAKAVVVLWSKTSTDSHWVHDEATRGRDRKVLVPLSIDGHQPPLGFRQFQVIDASPAQARPGSAEMEKLVRAVAALHDQPRDFTVQGKPAPALANRRNLLFGGGALILGGGALAAWLTGLVGGKSAAAASVAVMPFENLSGNPAQAYFSDGLAAEVRAELSRNALCRSRRKPPRTYFATETRTSKPSHANWALLSYWKAACAGQARS